MKKHLWTDQEVYGLCPRTKKHLLTKVEKLQFQSLVSNSFNAILVKISSTQSWPAGFPNYVWSALMPLAGTPHDLYTQFLRKLSLLYSFVACLPFHAWFFQPSPLFISGLDKYWPVHCKCYTEQFNVMMSGGGPSQGCYG